MLSLPQFPADENVVLLSVYPKRIYPNCYLFHSSLLMRMLYYRVFIPSVFIRSRWATYYCVLSLSLFLVCYILQSSLLIRMLHYCRFIRRVFIRSRWGTYYCMLSLPLFLVCYLLHSSLLMRMLYYYVFIRSVFIQSRWATLFLADENAVLLLVYPKQFFFDKLIAF